MKLFVCVCPQNARAMLTDWRCGYYEFTKLANVMFAYELQVRIMSRALFVLCPSLISIDATG